MWNMEQRIVEEDTKKTPKFKVNIKNVDELINHINEELKLDEDSK